MCSKAVSFNKYCLSQNDPVMRGHWQGHWKMQRFERLGWSMAKSAWILAFGFCLKLLHGFGFLRVIKDIIQLHTHTSSQAWQYARSIHQGPEGGGRLDCGQTDGFAGSFGSEQGFFWGLCVVDSLLGPISYLKLWYVQSQLYIFIRVFWIKVSGGWGSMTCMRWKVNAEMGLTQTADLIKEILELLFLKIPIEENFNMFCGYPILTPMYIPFEWYWRRAKLLILTRPSLKHAMRMTLLKGKSQNWPSEPAVIRATP